MQIKHHWKHQILNIFHEKKLFPNMPYPLKKKVDVVTFMKIWYTDKN